MKAISINAYEIENDDGETMVFMTPKEFDFIKKQNDLKDKEIERLKEQLNDEIDDELKQSGIMVKQHNEIERLNNIINKAIEYMERYMFSQKGNYDYIHLLDILKGVDKE